MVSRQQFNFAPKQFEVTKAQGCISPDREDSADTGSTHRCVVETDTVYIQMFMFDR